MRRLVARPKRKGKSSLERSLSPGALAEDLVEVEGDGVLGDQSFDLVLEMVGQNPPVNVIKLSFLRHCCRVKIS